MWVTTNNIRATQIEESVIERVLNLYPEEKLLERPIFLKAFVDGEIAYKDLIAEADKLLIPWQMFFLTSANLNIQISHIEKQRLNKVSKKLIAKRKGAGDTTSKRIIDRLIRQQNYLIASGKIPRNSFCGSLKGMSVQDAAQSIVNYFGIDQSMIWRAMSKGWSLEYLIGKVESKNINISRGVLSNKLLPTHQVVPGDVYRNTSGIAIKDDCVPFIFLPNEVNPDEVESRQIYTLIYLLAIIGLDQYEFYVDKNFSATALTATGIKARLHLITSELLIPVRETAALRGTAITPTFRDDLSLKFKVSPTALLTTLLMRKIITRREYDNLKPTPHIPKKRASSIRQPRVSTSVKKFCGTKSFDAINAGIQNGSLKSIEAQYLIFGVVNKMKYRKYCSELGI